MPRLPSSRSTAATIAASADGMGDGCPGVHEYVLNAAKSIPFSASTVTPYFGIGAWPARADTRAPHNTPPAMKRFIEILFSKVTAGPRGP